MQIVKSNFVLVVIGNMLTIDWLWVKISSQDTRFYRSFLTFICCKKETQFRQKPMRLLEVTMSQSLQHWSPLWLQVYWKSKSFWVLPFYCIRIKMDSKSFDSDQKSDSISNYSKTNRKLSDLGHVDGGAMVIINHLEFKRTLVRIPLPIVSVITALA